MARFSSIAFGYRLLKPDPRVCWVVCYTVPWWWCKGQVRPRVASHCTAPAAGARCLVTAQLLTSRGTSVAVTKPGARIENRDLVNQRKLVIGYRSPAVSGQGDFSLLVLLSPRHLDHNPNRK